MKKIYLIILGMFLISFASSSLVSLGTFSQDECFNISQTCASCSYVNISSISSNTNSTLVSNVPMVYFGNSEWRYEFCNTTDLGRYDVRGVGDINSVDASFTTYFEITPSGNSGSSNMVFFIIVIFLLYGLNIIGFTNENAPLTILSGMALIFLGIYLINNGIVIYRDNLTNYIGYVTIGWGFVSSMVALWNGYLYDF